MPGLSYLISKWWKQIITVVLVSLITAAVISILLPKKYLSVATALPANSTTADKARIFNENIEALYSTLGNADELDRIVGTGQLDTLYLAATDLFDLAAHYKVSEAGPARRRMKAAYQLKKNSTVFKSGYGELKVKVWDKDKILAAQLANTIMDKIQAIHSDLNNINNQSIVAALSVASQTARAQLDSINGFINTHKTEERSVDQAIAQKQSLSERVQQYDKMIAEYQLMTATRPPALLIVERARAASWHDTPRLLVNLLATAFLSLVFAVLLALVLEKNQLRRA